MLACGLNSDGVDEVRTPDYSEALTTTPPSLGV